MKTRDEIEKLKADWLGDQGWDLEDSDGFEDHKTELAAYQAQVEAEQRAKAAERHEEAVQKLITKAAEILPKAPEPSASMTDAERERLAEMVGPTRDVANAEGSTVNILLRLMAEMVLPLQCQVERQKRQIAKQGETIADLQHDLDRHIGRPT